MIPKQYVLVLNSNEISQILNALGYVGKELKRGHELHDKIWEEIMREQAVTNSNGGKE